MKYKSGSIEKLDVDKGIDYLCYYNGYYYFETEHEIEWAEAVSDVEFEQAVSSIVNGNPIFSETEQQPSQLDRIEAAVQTNAELQAFYDEIIEEAGL